MQGAGGSPRGLQVGQHLLPLSFVAVAAAHSPSHRHLAPAEHGSDDNSSSAGMPEARNHSSEPRASAMNGAVRGR